MVPGNGFTVTPDSSEELEESKLVEWFGPEVGESSGLLLSAAADVVGWKL